MNLALKILGTVACGLMTVAVAEATTFEWSGGYRLEWVNLEKPSLTNNAQSKSYVLNHLYLSPKIVGSDGFNIISRFDLVSAGQKSENSQLGLIWGNTNSPTGTSKADALTSGTEDFKISQLYMRFDQEYGQIIVGRSPFEFGLGMTYSAGQGLFDHWYSVRDMAAYKFMINDWFFMPVISRASDGSTKTGGGMNSLGLMLQYENPDTRSLIGIFQETKKGTQGTNDLNLSYAGGTVVSGYDIQRTNVVFGRGWDSFDLKLEAGFVSGSTGLDNASNERINLNGYGIAVEMALPAPEAKWQWSAKMGLASGDDPDSSTYEAFTFNPNYEVGMLLFNHRIGQADFLTSAAARNAGVANADAFDDEVVGNTMYVAPSATYAWKEKTDVKTTVVYAQMLNSQQNSLSSAKDLGLELDVEFIYKPTKTVQWINQIGFLLPGEAWKNGPAGAEFSNDFSYGFVSKAAISF